ncbi:MAG: hypothetical protein IRY83_15005 [Chloroflexi bacterium]|nr:hypothetical protein [Chloroflexota bacterium]
MDRATLRCPHCGKPVPIKVDATPQPMSRANWTVVGLIVVFVMVMLLIASQTLLPEIIRLLDTSPSPPF